ncbi:MAG TPA: hypothetical protein PLH92_07545 [Mycobacterium sp.]|nr:hypothetical protein [Mycolicibacterium sp.]HPX37708.1 hypothetical protein [Mycobacterium sp.]HQC76557.1 hypothetical protein [Mycobacterium sp.]
MGHWKSIEERRREREQQARDGRAEAAKDYLADIAMDGPDGDGED